MINQADTIAVLWSDGYNSQFDTKAAGHIYLKTANETQDYWRAKTFVFRATVNSWGLHPAMIFDHTAGADTVLVAWTQADNCNGFIFNCTFNKIQFSQCDVSSNINACTIPETIATAPSGHLYINPHLAQDDDGQLHAIWQMTDNLASTTDLIYYSLGSPDGGGYSWSGSSQATAAGGARDAQLIASNDRLHIIWDDEAGDTINYFYDDNDDDTTLTPANGIEQFVGNVYPYSISNPDNPTLEAKGDWLFAGFDVENWKDPRKSALFYTMSADNGSTWQQTLSIPDQGYAVNMYSTKPSFALKPNFTITSTGSVTHVSVVWHEEIAAGSDSFPLFGYRIRFSSLALTEPIVDTPYCLIQPEQCWSDPLAITHLLSPTGKDTSAANLVITEPPGGGEGTGHIVYRQDWDKTNNAPVIHDIYYEGGISRTIDPAYILDEFSGGDPNDPHLFKQVVPTHIQTFTSSVNEVLSYTIIFENRGNLDAVGVGITDTLPSTVVLNGGLGSITAHSNLVGPLDVGLVGDQMITWFGDVRAGERIEIKFSVTTVGTAIQSSTTIRNKLEMWNIGSVGHQPFLTNYADTIITLLENTYTISGQVADASANPLTAVTVWANAEYSATTNLAGSYIITGLPGGTYTLTPFLGSHPLTTSPPTRTVTLPPAATGQDFVRLGGETIHLPLIVKQ